jgi:mannose-6-phosphate isomerase-like protein (cupin superfamily)
MRDERAQRTGLMLLLRIERWDVRRDGALTESALQQKLVGLGFDVAPRTYHAGGNPFTHTDARERIQGVAAGFVRVTLDGESAILSAGDILFVPRGAGRRVEVVGTSAAYCLEGVYRSPDPAR